jgi:hypothetical protein
VQQSTRDARLKELEKAEQDFRADLERRERARLVGASTGVAAIPNLTLEELLSESERQLLGLEKLSAAERHAMARFINSKLAFAFLAGAKSEHK